MIQHDAELRDGFRAAPDELEAGGEIVAGPVVVGVQPQGLVQLLDRLGRAARVHERRRVVVAGVVGRRRVRHRHPPERERGGVRREPQRRDRGERCQCDDRAGARRERPAEADGPRRGGDRDAEHR